MTKLRVSVNHAFSGTAFSAGHLCSR